MTFPQRAIGAARLEVPVFEEIEADRQATSQALLVVVLSSMAAGIGLTTNYYNAPVLHRVMLALLLWVFWAISTYVVGVYLMPEPQTNTTVGELLRTLGFATAPGCLRILGFLPGVAIPVFAVTAIWMLAAMVVAVRQALDYDSTVRAVAVCAIGWTMAVVIVIVLGLIFGPSLS